ncbi:ABC transporter permease [Roseomonas sp. OT10]|uniref:ABC transporter permease n=1 Tax=Roseomonas cutis TaxID=2897332 RepID=UPI001E5D2836|nr:ABC transporter permease [Roseomonas sp. OT10]UFN48449.1 ABC transporter permease [Roseomonas sp. OT10]
MAGTGKDVPAVAPEAPVGTVPVPGEPSAAWRDLLRLPALTSILSVACFVLLWWGVAAWVASPIQLPTPAAVFAALVELVLDGEVYENVSVSFLRLLLSMAVASALALPLGFAMGLSERVNGYVDPLVEMLRPISGIAWIPLGLFIFGVGGTLPVFIMTYVAFFPMLLNTVAGVRGTDRKLVAAARTMGVSQARIIRLVVLPGALPTMMVGVRIAFAGAWAAIIAAELIGSPSGLGFAIEWYRQLLMSPNVFAYIIVVSIVGYACDLLIQGLRRRLTPWATGTELA